MPAAELADKALRAIVPANQLALVRVQIAWVDALPEALTHVAAPVGIDDDALVVHVRDNQWLHELQYMRADVLARLSKAVPRIPIRQLRMRVGEVPPLPRRELAPLAHPRDHLPLQPAPETIEAIGAVSDPLLKNAIATARQALTRLGHET